jgi:hypothetical protein
MLVFAFFLVFIVFNLDNKCDVSFGFKAFREVPVFLTAFASFVLGMLFTLPFVFPLGKRKKKAPVAPYSPPGPGGKRRWGKSKSPIPPEDIIGSGDSAGTEEIKKEASSYGID